MRADPIRQLLAPRRLGVRKARRAQGGDEYLDRDDLAGTGVDYLGGAPGEIDEELLAGDMDLAHRRLQSAGPAPVQSIRTPSREKFFSLTCLRHVERTKRVKHTVSAFWKLTKPRPPTQLCGIRSLTS